MNGTVAPSPAKRSTAFMPATGIPGCPAANHDSNVT
jgi:hypothetical protein